MNSNLDLTSNEIRLIDTALQIMMTKNVKASMKTTEKSARQHYENFNLELIALRSKLKKADSLKTDNDN